MKGRMQTRKRKTRGRIFKSNRLMKMIKNMTRGLKRRLPGTRRHNGTRRRNGRRMRGG